jgi:hypothetical protein
MIDPFLWSEDAHSTQPVTVAFKDEIVDADNPGMNYDGRGFKTRGS